MRPLTLWHLPALTLFVALGCMALPDNARAFGTTTIFVDSASVIKTGPANVAPGSTITYTLRVTKSHPAFTARIIDTFPVGLIFNAAASSSGCTAGSQIVCTWPATGTYYLTQVQPVTQNFTLVFTVPPTIACGSLTNTASVTAPTNSIVVYGRTGALHVIVTDSNTSNNVSRITTPIINCFPPPDLTISKNGPTTAVRGGAPLTYTVTATNTSTTSNAANVTITDAVPAGLTFDPSGSTAGCTLQGSNVVCPVGTLTPGASATVTLRFTTAPTGGNCTETQVINRATVSTTTIESNTANNTAQFTTRLTCEFNCIDVIKETFNTQGQPMSPVTQFTFQLDGGATISNDGSGRARFTNVSFGPHTVTETIPGGWTQLSVTPAGGAVTVSPTDSQCDVVTFKNQQVFPPVDVTITKTGIGNAVHGDVILYTISVTNNGPGVAQNVTVTDPQTGILQFVSGQSDGSCVRVGNSVVCGLGSLNPQQTRLFTIAMDAGDGSCTASSVQNQASVTTTSPESNTGNNQSQIVTTQLSASASCTSSSAASSMQSSAPASSSAASSIVSSAPASSSVASSAPASSSAQSSSAPLSSSAASSIVSSAPLSSSIASSAPASSSVASSVQSSSAPSSSVASSAASSSLQSSIASSVPASSSAASSALSSSAPSSIASSSAVSSSIASSVPSSSAVSSTPQGCVRVVKETFGTQGQILTPVAQFTFMLDGNRNLSNDGSGVVTFTGVSVGNHTVSESVPSGWTQLSITPAGGTVQVSAGENCAVVYIKNQQVIQYASSSSVYIPPYYPPYEPPYYPPVYHPPVVPPPVIVSGCQNGDLQVSKTADRSEAQPGDIVSYTITVRNQGNAVINSVIVQDIMDGNAGATVVDPNGGQVNGSSLTWNTGTLTGGTSRTIGYTVRLGYGLRQGDSVRNSVTVQGSCGQVATSTTVAIIEQLPQTGVISDFFGRGSPYLTKITGGSASGGSAGASAGVMGILLILAATGVSVGGVIGKKFFF